MKISRSIEISFHRSRQRGMAVAIILILLSIILIFVSANLRELYQLNQELRLTEHQQLKRVEALSAANEAALKNRPTTGAQPGAAGNSQ